jgi:hypothetical protein
MKQLASILIAPSLQAMWLGYAVSRRNAWTFKRLSPGQEKVF